MKFTRRKTRALFGVLAMVLLVIAVCAFMPVLIARAAGTDVPHIHKEAVGEGSKIVEESICGREHN